MSPSRIDIETRGRVLVVVPFGDIDLTNAADLRTAILVSLDNELTGVVVDLSTTYYLDSAGIRVLFSVARRLQERRREFALVAPRDAHVRRVLAIVDMANRIRTYETVDDAREALGA